MSAPSHQPGPAQQLVAKAGITVYEEGTDIMNESVLVYLGRPSTGWPTFEIFNHVDRSLGRTRSLGKPGRFALNGTTSIDNPLGTSMMEVRAKPNLFRVIYEVTGLTTGSIRMSTIGSGDMTLEANREPHGYVIGGHFGVVNTDLAVLDHRRDRVGTIHSYVERAGPHQLSISHVMSFDHRVGSVLRRLVLAVPIVIEGVRRNHAATAMQMDL